MPALLDCNSIPRRALQKRHFYHLYRHHHATEHSRIRAYSTFRSSFSLHRQNAWSRLVFTPQCEPREERQKADNMPLQLCPSGRSPVQRQLSLHWGAEWSTWHWKGRHTCTRGRRRRTRIRSAGTKRHQGSLPWVEHCCKSSCKLLRRWPYLSFIEPSQFLSHDGITTFTELVDAQQNLYNVDYDVAVTLATLGVGLDGDVATEKLSIGCDATSRTSATGDLLGDEVGLEGHNVRIEAYTPVSHRHNVTDTIL